MDSCWSLALKYSQMNFVELLCICDYDFVVCCCDDFFKLETEMV